MEIKKKIINFVSENIDKLEQDINRFYTISRRFIGNPRYPMFDKWIGVSFANTDDI